MKKDTRNLPDIDSMGVLLAAMPPLNLQGENHQATELIATGFVNLTFPTGHHSRWNIGAYALIP
jgi:hypothetical protein